MSSPTGLSEAGVAAVHHLRELREVNTVVLRQEGPPDVLVPELEANLTHDELVQGLPSDQPRLVLHELSFASPEGTRRNQLLLILWMPPAAAAQEDTYTAGYSALKDYLPDVHVHLTARRADQLAYRRLVALAG
ncbi:cofilin family protein [Streptomyces sp. NRRL F-2664]|uniref:cofilin family protein n=1 Tax=Streptomyces sp. NRRL F-2664 TaxID=1463842 RepID=UPI0004C493FB|nr:cofilin family protein [Streptomyces sp. NRRL F-2664]